MPIQPSRDFSSPHNRGHEFQASVTQIVSDVIRSRLMQWKRSAAYLIQPVLAWSKHLWEIQSLNVPSGFSNSTLTPPALTRYNQHQPDWVMIHSFICLKFEWNSIPCSKRFAHWRLSLNFQFCVPIFGTTEKTNRGVGVPISWGITYFQSSRESLWLRPWLWNISACHTFEPTCPTCTQHVPHHISIYLLILAVELKNIWFLWKFIFS